MDVLEEHSHKECVCLGEWLRSANKILNFNDISKREFAGAVQTGLEKGKRKKQNVMLTGPTNYGKSFLLNPLKDICNAFVNPPNSTFACVGAETAEIVHLNNFRWNEKNYRLGRHANSLRGCSCPHSSSHFAEDILWTKDNPIFCTSNARIKKYDHGQKNELESEMTDAKWITFPPRHQFCEPKETPACSKCFTVFLKNDSTL